jgi:hypothetical protein
MIKCAFKECGGDRQIIAVGIDDEDVASMREGGTVAADLKSLDIASPSTVVVFFGETQEDLTRQMWDKVDEDTEIINDRDDYQARNQELAEAFLTLSGNPALMATTFAGIRERCLELGTEQDAAKLGSWVRSVEALLEFLNAHSVGT